MKMKNSEKMTYKLNELLTKNYDAEAGYKKAAEMVSQPQLKQFFETQAQHRYDFGHELKTEIAAHVLVHACLFNTLFLFLFQSFLLPGARNQNRSSIEEPGAYAFVNARPLGVLLLSLSASGPALLDTDT